MQTCIQELNGSRENFEKHNAFEELENSGQVEKPKVELKTLPAHLKYVFLEDKESDSIILCRRNREKKERNNTKSQHIKIVPAVRKMLKTSTSW